MEVTLIKILQDQSAGNAGITFIESGTSEDFLSYKQLYGTSLKVLYNLQQKGIKPGNELVFQLEDNKAFIIVFWACLLGGIVPVPITVGQNDEHRKKIFNIWQVLNNPYLIITAENLQRLKDCAQRENINELYQAIANKIIDDSAAVSLIADGEIADIKEDDIAFIQFSSGSTGSPKGVIVTHKNLITNLKQISRAARYTPDDSMLSWMPLTHDMGLIGFHLNPLFVGMGLYAGFSNLYRRLTLKNE